jgi:hypothetical protein
MGNENYFQPTKYHYTTHINLDSDSGVLSTAIRRASGAGNADFPSRQISIIAAL